MVKPQIIYFIMYIVNASKVIYTRGSPKFIECADENTGGSSVIAFLNEYLIIM